MDRKQYMAEYQKKWWANVSPETRERYLSVHRERTRRLQATPAGKVSLCGRAKKFRDKIREQVLAAYCGCCACCGENEPVFLTLDHIIPLKSRKRPSSYQLYMQLRKEGYPVGYQILCYNCNHAKGTKVECPHNALVRQKLHGVTA